LAGFLSVDPVLDTQKALKEPQRWNRYSYVINNPLRYTDPDGRDIYAQVHEVTTETSDYIAEPAYHVSLRIEPNDQAAWAGDDRFTRVNAGTGRHYATIGAGPENSLGSLLGRGGNLIAGVNRKTDADLTNKVIEFKLNIGARDENKVIYGLFKTTEAYKNNVPYKINPRPFTAGYNSNSFAAGLMRAVGLVPPTIRMNVPGYTKPVPLTNPCPNGRIAGSSGPCN
jgi:hypothetical protein